MKTAPLPPAPLVRRVGWVVGAEKHSDVYADRGLEQWRFIKSLLPPDWDISGRRALDFGCGAGRILRHAAVEDPGGEYWGCDIHQPSIAWLQTHLSPPLNVLESGDWPPLELPDAHFDLIWAFSVFTHLTDAWSAWLTELHRLLKPDGILIATVFGPGHTSFCDQPISEDIIGMRVLFPTASWDTGGPLVLHSRWWLEAHWGRAFDILDFRPGHQDGRPPLYGQGAVVMRKRHAAPGPAELELPEPGEPREVTALQNEVAALRDEVITLNRRLDVCYGSRSWRITAPLRAVGERLRNRSRRSPGQRLIR